MRGWEPITGQKISITGFSLLAVFTTGLRQWARGNGRKGRDKRERRERKVRLITICFHEDEHQCRAFPANTLIRSSGFIPSREPSELLLMQKTELPRFTTVCLRKAQRHALPELFGVNDQPVVARGCHSGLISTLRLLSIFCLYTDTDCK